MSIAVLFPKFFHAHTIMAETCPSCEIASPCEVKSISPFEYMQPVRESVPEELAWMPFCLSDADIDRADETSLSPYQTVNFN